MTRPAVGLSPEDPGHLDRSRVGQDPSSHSRRNHFTSIALDRLAERRDDADWLAAARIDPATRFLPLWRSRCLLHDVEGEPRPVVLGADQLDAALDPAAAALLGDDGRRAWFALAVDDAQAKALLRRYAGAGFHDLRTVADLDERDAGILAYARALLYWHYRNVFCASCGAPLERASAGHRLLCTNAACGRESFPRIDPAVIVLVTHDDACLLGHNPRWPQRRYSTLAGYVEPGESLEDAVAREVYEEARVRLARVEYRSAQPWPFPSSLMCGFRAAAVDRDCQAGEELSSLLWLTAAELRDAVRADEVRLPPPLSIAFRLIADWYAETGEGELEPLVRAAGGWLPRKRIE